MMNNNDFTPAEGVTLENALQYVAAVGDAVRRDIMKLPLEERNFIAGLLAGGLLIEANGINKHRAGMVQRGEAIPITKAQQEQINWMIRRICNRTQDN